MNMLRYIPVLAVLLSGSVQAQQLISTDGGTATLGTTTISWSVGEPIVGTGTVPGGIVTQGFQQPNLVKVRLNVAALLQGPYNSGTGLMNDGLRANGLVPLTEPYTALGYTFVGNGGESTTAPVLAVTGNDAIVDWVVVELRDASDPTLILASQSALLQRDGDVVATDGVSPLSFRRGPGEHHIALLHRNHLGVMTFAPVALETTPTTVDFTLASTVTFGTQARKDANGIQLFWAGDVSFDGVLKYTGADNDRDPILQAIGGIVPTATVAGYHQADVDLDGTVKYTGADNDRDPILQNIGGVVPTSIRVEQLP